MARKSKKKRSLHSSNGVFEQEGLQAACRVAIDVAPGQKLPYHLNLAVHASLAIDGDYLADVIQELVAKVIDESGANQPVA